MLDFGKFWYTWKLYGAGDFKRLKVAKNINFGSVLVDFTEAFVSRCSSKWMFLKISQIPTHLFSREIYEIFKNTFFTEHLWRLSLVLQQPLKESIW